MMRKTVYILKESTATPMEYRHINYVVNIQRIVILCASLPILKFGVLKKLVWIPKRKNNVAEYVYNNSGFCLFHFWINLYV